MIKLQGVEKSYEQGRVQALRGISLSVERAESVALMGPSGCGKSTLLNLLGALDEVDRGRILIAGRPLESYRPFHRYRRNMVGFVFQFHHLIASLSLLENVLLPLQSTPVPVAERRQRALDLLEQMALSHRADFRPNDVSGGERQRAAIARALVNHPAIVLADEPTGNLDSATGSKVMRFLLEHAAQRQATVLVATHNEEIAALCDRSLKMLDGALPDDESFRPLEKA
jgi:putative ABC transport system ATP-binding protein